MRDLFTGLPKGAVVFGTILFLVVMAVYSPLWFSLKVRKWAQRS